jgi:serine-type D-Ala-D-Ala carboxypeptidase (penicillin-binding protein 5/6)
MVRKVKKKKPRISIFAAFLIMSVIAALVYSTLANHHIFVREYDNKNSSDSSGNRITPVTQPKIEPDSPASISSDKLNSPNAVMIRLKDQTILMQKNSEEKIYPASLTKIMTAIVAIENLPNLKEKIKLTNSSFKGLYEADASMAGFEPGEQVRAIDLLYGVMLPSGAECCIGLADKIAGSEQSFVKVLNQKAADLGMKNTHFENATGLHNINHYTTVKDLAILLSYALKNDTFREIFTSFRYSTPPTNKHPGGISFKSTMFEELNIQNIIGGEILGGKTGYTDEAGLCLASLAKVGKQEYIMISAGAKGNHYSKQYNIIDALAVYNSIGK